MAKLEKVVRLLVPLRHHFNSDDEWLAVWERDVAAVVPLGYRRVDFIIPQKFPVDGDGHTWVLVTEHDLAGHRVEIVKEVPGVCEPGMAGLVMAHPHRGDREFAVVKFDNPLPDRLMPIVEFPVHLSAFKIEHS